MNRQQRRATAREALVDLRKVVMPHQMTPEECKTAILMRIQDNARETAHPYHHKTANGTIVEPDPTLEYLMKRLEQSPAQKEDLAQIRGVAQRFIEEHANAPKAVPVNRKYYGHDPYEAR